MDRDQFIEQQTALLDRAFSLTSGEETLRARFEAMALETYEHLHRAEVFILPFSIGPHAGVLGYGEHVKALVSTALLQKWLDWEEEYPRILDRNPRLALHDYLHWISESHDASSWPYGREAFIYRWLVKGERLPTPFDDRHDLVTPEFYERLREARRKAGGMLYWHNDKRQVCFADDSEWQTIAAEQDKRHREEENRFAEIVEHVARHQKRSSEVLAAARDDIVFWEALKAWEFSREAKRPTEVQPPTSRSLRTFTGPLRFVALSHGEQIKQDDSLLVDPFFTDFIARSHQPEDALTAYAIVITLRSEVRRELGLDAVLGWPGGPSPSMSV